MSLPYDRFKIYPLTSTQYEISVDLNNYFDRANTYNDYYNYYAVTLTIPKAEYDTLKQSKTHNVIGYFSYLLKLCNLQGLYIQELTKRGVIHLHGVVCTNKINRDTKYRRKIKGKWSYSYVLKDYPFEHIVKDIPTSRAQNAWCSYMIKNQRSKSLLEYLQTDLVE